MKLYVKRVISIAHHLPNYDGLCRNVHGHSLLVEVWITGTKDHDTGMVIDFHVVKDIIDKYDHTDLNDVLENPTAENFAELLNQEFKDQLYIQYVCVRVWESSSCWVEAGYAA